MNEGQENNKNTMPKGFGNPKRPKINIYWIYGILALLIFGVQFLSFKSDVPQINSSEQLRQMLQNKEIKNVIVVNDAFAEIYIQQEFLSKYPELKQEGIGSSEPYMKYEFLTIENFEKDINELAPGLPRKKVTRKDWTSDLLGWLFPLILIVVFWMFIMKRMGGAGGGGQIFNIGKSKAQVFDKDTSVKIDFHNVAGMKEAKQEVMEIVDFLKNPKKYTALGGKIPKGALLIGPPGTGKTLLAKAMAGEAKVPFFSLSGSDFVEMFVGVGASRVRDLFKQAKDKAPCIVFIDEIDAIGRARGKNAITGANDERENTLNQLLSEMDGFGTNAGVIIIAATNRADILDRALMRAGRFDRQIHVELPDLDERLAIFKVHMKPLKIGSDVDTKFLSKQTSGFSGADIANVCNESALIAARKNKKAIEKQDFLDAIDRIIGGLEKRNKFISKDEKKVIAFHEAGHAATSWLLEHAHPLVKVTIVPRGKALGAAWYLPEERQITTFEQMYDEMTAICGGRASEKVFFGKISTGALNDLEKITKQAYAMVAYFGMNDKLGNISFYDSSGQNEYGFTKPYSESTASVIDTEVSELVEKAYNRAVKLLTENKEKVEELATVLLEREVIFSDDLKEIFGERPYEGREEHRFYEEANEPFEADSDVQDAESGQVANTAEEQQEQAQPEQPEQPEKPSGNE